LWTLKTIKKVEFVALPYHNQIPTMGEWSWIVALNNEYISNKNLKISINDFQFSNFITKFINKDAMISMTHFRKGVIGSNILDIIKYNTELNPVLYGYFLKGSWGIY